MKLLLIALTLSILSSCSYITDYLLKDEDGVHLDTQLGSNENKVKTGVGSLGLDKETNLTIEDSSHVAVKNSDNRYKISTTGDTTVNVYETNYWLYAIFALFVIAKPLLRTLWKRRQQQHLYQHIDSISTLSRTSMDRNHNNTRRSS